MLFDFASRGENNTQDLPPLLFDTVDGKGTDYALISGKASIRHRLQEIARNRQQVRLHLFHDHDVAGIFNSSIQRLDFDKDEAILHQLTPGTWRQLVRPNDPVTVSCYLSSGHVVFDSTIAPLEAGANNPFCVLQFPREIHVQQLRTAFRVAMLPNSGRIELRIGKQVLQGKCLDISLSGCCVQFPITLEEALEDIETPHDGWPMRLLYDGREVFQARAVIMRRKHEVAGLVTVGLSFAQPDPARTRSLQPLLLALQRERIRLWQDNSDR